MKQGISASLQVTKTNSLTRNPPGNLENENECQISQNYILHMKFSQFYLCFHNRPIRLTKCCTYHLNVNATL